MATQTRRITKDDWWDICYAMERHLEEMTRWQNATPMDSTVRSIERNEELLRHLVNTKLSERDKYMSFPEWVEY